MQIQRHRVLKGLPGVDAKQAETYRRGLRRMVWLATQDEPEEQAKEYPDWAQKALVSRGWWIEGYDDLTGDEVAEHIVKVRASN